MPRAAVATLAVLAVLGMIAVVFWPSERPSDAEDPGPSHAQQEVAPAPAEAAAVESGPAETQRIESPIAHAEPASESGAEPAYSTFEGPNATLVRALDKESKDPIPFADIWVLTQEMMEDERALEAAFSSGESTIEELICAYGDRYRADANGEARTAPLADYPMVFARQKDKSALSMRVDVVDNQVELLLEPDLSLVVVVRDQSGQPAPGAPVALRMDMQSMRFTLFTRYADEHGELHFQNLRPLLENGPSRGENMHVAIGMPMAADAEQDKTQAKLSDEVLAAGRVELEIPDSGSVHVQILQSNGEPFEEEAIVSLIAESTDNEGGDREFDDRGLMRRVNNGEVVFPYVGLGLELELQVESFLASASDSQRFTGPQQAGEVIQLKMLRDARPTLRYRVLDTNGQALQNRRLSAKLDLERADGSRSPRDSFVVSDGEGWIAQEVDLDWLQRESYQALAVDVELLDPEHGLLIADTRFVGELQPGVVDLGELRLTRAPDLVSGKVIDQQGHPIAQAAVQLMRRSEGDEDLHFVLPRRNPSNYTTTRADGSFQLQGKVDLKVEYQITVSCSGFESASQNIVLGAEDLTITLSKGAFFAGSVLLDPRIEPYSLNVRAYGEGHSTEWVNLQQGEEEGVAHFAHMATPGEPFRFTIETDAGEVLYEKPSIVLQPGQTLRPAELQPLDLREVLRVVELQVLGPHGKPIEATVAISVEGGSWSSTSRGDGVFALPTVQGMREVIVTAPGMATQRLHDVRDDQVVRMQPALEVYFQIEPSLLADERVELTLFGRLDNDHDSPHFGNHGSGAFDASGRARWFADEPGQYRVHIMATLQKEDSRYSSSIHQEIVSISAAGQVVSLSVDPERLRKMIEDRED